MSNAFEKDISEKKNNLDVELNYMKKTHEKEQATHE